MAYSDALRQQYATFTSAADLIDGVLSASTVFSGFSLASATAELYISQYSANANAAALFIQKSRNATVGNHTIVNNGDEVGRINFAPSNGTGFQTAASIIAFVDGAPSGTGDLPVGLVFQTTPDGSGTIAERMRIDDAGNIGIGRNSPGTYGNLEIGGSAYAATGILSSSASGSILVLAANGTSETRINTNSNHPMVFYTNNTERMRITAAGEMLVGGSTDQGAYNLQCNGTGVWGAGAYVNGSDLRLKENVEPIGPCLNLINQLNPITFNYLDTWSSDQAIQPGFIAQEVETVLQNTDFVNGIVQAGGEYLGLAYQNLIPLLVKSIQELNAKIESLESRIQILES